MKAPFFILILISSLIFPLQGFAFDEELFGDEIFIEPEVLKLNIEKTVPESYRETNKTEKAGVEINLGGVSLFSNSKTELNDYMTTDYKSTMGAVLNPKGRLSVASGMEIKHQNPNASINSKKLYVSSDLRLSDDISLSFANKFNREAKTYENEFGIKYRPKFFKDGNFGITTGAVFDEEAIKSQNIKFSTDLFLF